MPRGESLRWGLCRFGQLLDKNQITLKITPFPEYDFSLSCHWGGCIKRKNPMNQFIKPSTHWLSGIGYRLILAALVSVFATAAFAADCKVNDSDKSAEYVGDCDNGLVQGKRKKKSKRYVPEVAQPANASVVSNNQQAVVAPIADTPTMPQQTISTISQPQSLINNKSIKNFQAKFSTDIATNVGSGSCETSIANIKAAGNEILVTVKKPKKCAFETLELIYGSDVFPLSGLGEEFETKNALYKWRDDVQQGSLLFSKNSNQLVINPAELKIREPRCGDVNCLTSTGLPPQKEITESPQPEAKSNTSSTGLPPQKEITVSQQPEAKSSTFAESVAENLTTLEQGLFRDNRTGLIWRRCALGRTFNEKRTSFQCEGKATKAPWLDMVILASRDRYAGFNDWRLPTATELSNLLSKKPKKALTCYQFQRRVTEVFPLPLEGVQDDTNYWTSSNIDSMFLPYVALLEPNGIHCPLFDQVRPHRLHAAVFVRGGLIPDDWKVALSKTTQAKSLFNESKKETDARESKLKSDTADFWSSVSGASSNSSSGAKFEIYKDKGQAASWEWYKREVVLRCLQGREKGGLPSVYLLPSGRWKTTYKGEHGTMSDAANAACD